MQPLAERPDVHEGFQEGVLDRFVDLGRVTQIVVRDAGRAPLMPLDHLREAITGLDPISTGEQGAHLVGDQRIDGGTLLAREGRGICGGHHLQAALCSWETKTAGRAFTAAAPDASRAAFDLRCTPPENGVFAPPATPTAMIP